MPALAERPRSVSKGSAIKLRCIVYQQAPNCFVGECIDLDILVKGKTPERAIESLKDAVSGYLKVACNGDTKGLVPRPSPLSHRVRYHWYRLLKSVLFPSRNNLRLFDCPPSYC